MRPTRRSNKRPHNPIESSDEDEPLKKKSPELKNPQLSEESSSDSDIESYLKSPSKLDLNSSFFNPSISQPLEVTNKSEERVAGRLSDSESSDDEDPVTNENKSPIDDEIPSTSTMNNFEHINAYNAKFEEAKRLVEMYKANRKEVDDAPMEVDDILEKEERAFFNSLGSSGFESFSEEEDKSDWEEVQAKDDRSLIRKEGVEITIDVPGNVKKKKSLDLMAAIKRRINRVRKENQVYVHKVHLLSWIAHGFYVNTTLNSQNLLGLALSLLPSKHCYPANRIDLHYLENIVGWYKKTMGNKNSVAEIKGSLEGVLEEQILRKEAHNYKMYTYIFICILRSLGVKCRLILSLQIEPLRPPQSELCSLSNKNQEGDTNLKETKKVAFKPNSSKILNSSLNRSARELDKKAMITPLKNQQSKIGKSSDQTELKEKVSLKDKLKKSDKKSISKGRPSKETRSKETSQRVLSKDKAVKGEGRDSTERKSKNRTNTQVSTENQINVNVVKDGLQTENSEETEQKEKPLNSKCRIKDSKNDIKETKSSSSRRSIKIKVHQSPSEKNEESKTSGTLTLPQKSVKISSRTQDKKEATTELSKDENKKAVKNTRSSKNPSAISDKIKESSTSNQQSTVSNKTNEESQNPIEDNTGGIKSRLRRNSKSPTILNPQENPPEEKEIRQELSEESTSGIKSKLRRNSKSPTILTPQEKEIPEENTGGIKSRLRRNSKSPTILDSQENPPEEKELPEENGGIKSRLRRNSKSPTILTPQEKEIPEENTGGIKSRLRRNSKSPTILNPQENPPEEEKKLGLKIKMPFHNNRKSLSDVTPEIEQDEELQNETLRQKFALPIIKNEPPTPKKCPNDSSEDFPGFSAEELTGQVDTSPEKKLNLTTRKECPNDSNEDFLGFSAEHTEILIPQLDGGADTPSKKKPNLTKLNSALGEKCPRNHPTRLKKAVPRYADVDSDDDFVSSGSSITKTSPFKAIQSKASTSSQDSDRSGFFGGSPSKPKQLDVRNDIISLVKGAYRNNQQKLSKRKSSNKKSNEDDSDYFPEELPKKKSKNDGMFKEKNTVKVKRRIPMKKDLLEIEKKMKQDKEELKRNKGVNVWVEVFADAEEKWISVDVIEGQVHCVKEIYSRATHPISYIIGFDNDNHVKDITKRYCENWNTVTRKLRVESKWWEKTLAAYRAPRNAREKEEDEDLARMQLDQPLPKTISEYKNHPLYVLRRHLLKFEAIYPPDSLTLGFVRNEPVYSRDCVYVLHSRDIWLKHAKVVKLGETPYKIVKARPKYDKLSNTVISDQMLEIFGKWQVEDYVPPTAENGIVPKNAYGNVDLFKPCMLPKGTVHLQLPALNKTARKLNIDCPPAVTGFDFHSGFSHPVFDGFVVCEEFSELLVAAWFEEAQELERKEREKHEKRVYDNWKKLIKGLLIRERLNRRYAFGTSSASQDKKSKGSKKKR